MSKALFLYLFSLFTQEKGGKTVKKIINEAYNYILNIKRGKRFVFSKKYFIYAKAVAFL